MDACQFSETHLHRYRGNLTALSETEPQLAEQLEALDIPATVEQAAGRDGSDTFRIRGDDGSWHWFGRSSMPTVSAASLLGGFQSSGRNVILPGIGTSHEIPLVAARLPPHCAVLVHEADLLAVKLALHLQDFSEMIRRSRLVLLCGEDLIEALVEAYRRRPGLEFPHQMLPLPTQSAAQQERARLLLQAAAQRVALEQGEAAEALAGEVSRRTCFSLGPSPRVAVLSRDPRPETVELARGLTEALNRLGWPAACAVPDRPDACHALSRLQLIRRRQPDLVLLLNCLAGPLAGFLPERQPTCSWLITVDSVEGGSPDWLASSGPVFAAQPAILERLIAAGAGRDQVHLLERATDPTVFDPQRLDAEARKRWACQVAVLADGCDLRASAMNITLASQVRLWEALCRRAEGMIDHWRDGLAERLLELGEGDGDARLSEPELRNRFLALIRHRLMPTLTARFMIERLVGEKLDLAVWGTGWETHSSVRRLVKGPGTDAAGRHAAYTAAQVVVRPWYDEHTPQTVLDCLAADGCPVFLLPEGRLDRLHPQLHDVLKQAPGAASPTKLAALAKRLLADTHSRREATARARQEVLDMHTLTVRLTTIRDTMAAQL